MSAILPRLGEVWAHRTTGNGVPRRVIEVIDGVVVHRNAYGRSGPAARTAIDEFTTTYLLTGAPKANNGRRHAPRSETVYAKGMKRIVREDEPADAELLAELAANRPTTRGDCEAGERPCPFLSCRHHLYLDVNPDTGSIKLNFPDKELHELADTCALDVADRQGITLEHVGSLMNVTRERIRQMETRALARLAQSKEVA